MTQEAQQHQPDPLAKIWSEIRKERDRIRKIQEASIKRVMQEMADTVMSYVEDFVYYVLQFRNWVASEMTKMDERIALLEEDVPLPLLTEEDVEMLQQLTTRCEALARLALEQSTNLSANAKTELEETVALCGQVNAWILDNIESDDDDDGEGEVDDDDDAKADEVEALPGNGAPS